MKKFNRPVRKTDWKNKPFPEEHKALEGDFITFSEDEYEKLRGGFMPRVMEDKWFIYFDDDKLYCHRSWTGICIYVAHFRKKDENEYVLDTLKINRNKDQYSATDDKKDIAIFLSLIGRFLLGKKVKLPQLRDDEFNVISQWSIFGRQMFE